jgi:hypothetical protein
MRRLEKHITFSHRQIVHPECHRFAALRFRTNTLETIFVPQLAQQEFIQNWLCQDAALLAKRIQRNRKCTKRRRRRCGGGE